MHVLAANEVSEYSLTMRRDQLLSAGMRLFAERGYRATSVADIQTACGLAAGSGALYKHFPSKEALLAAGVHRYIGELQESGHKLMDLLPDEPDQALGMIARAVLDAMAGQHAIIRVGLRDLEQFPDLLAVLWDGLMVTLYDQLAGWLAAQQTAGRIGVDDPAATAAVLMASLTYYEVLLALCGRAPGNIDCDRYLAAWVDSATATLTAAKEASS